MHFETIATPFVPQGVPPNAGSKHLEQMRFPLVFLVPTSITVFEVVVTVACFALGIWYVAQWWRERRPKPLAWWQRFPKGCGLVPRPPTPLDRPKLEPGDAVWLLGKPDRPRRVLTTEWHWHRHEYVYVVETTAPSYFRPYWFYDQLRVETKSEA